MNESIGFKELPQSLVIDVLEQTQRIEQELLQSFEDLRIKKEEWRRKLIEKNLLEYDSNLPPVRSPTTCGVDGSYAVEKLLTTDVVVIGAVAVEGFTPPSEKCHWPDPKHFVHLATEAHSPDTSTILRAGMIGLELVLARNAPHDLVLLDGSFTTPIISFNQWFSNAQKYAHFKIVKEYLVEKVKKFLDAYHDILAPQRTDRQWVAVPKYTTRREIGSQIDDEKGSLAFYDDRGLLTFVLNAGEYTRPISLQKPSSDWHLNFSANDFTTDIDGHEIERLANQIEPLLSDIYVLYYRPRAYMPALRLEINKAIADNKNRLAIVLQGIKDQYGKASIMEPYPLYMADRMVGHLPQALPTCRHRISQSLAENYQGNIDDIFVGLHSYRTEPGR